MLTPLTYLGGVFYSISLPHEWPEAVDKQIENLGEEVPEEAKVGRVDLRELPLVTIDGEDARDFVSDNYNFIKHATFMTA